MRTYYPASWYNESTDKEQVMVEPIPPTKERGGCARKVVLSLLVIALMALSFELGAYYALVRLCSHC